MLGCSVPLCVNITHYAMNGIYELCEQLIYRDPLNDIHHALLAGVANY